MKSLSIKMQLVIFLSCFAVYLAIKDKDIAFLLTTALAIISASSIEWIIEYLKNKKIVFSESPVISGLIIGFVLSSDNKWWVFVLASLIAISFKYLIRVNKKHIFNPAALSIFLVTILFNASTQWRGTYLWYILLPAGLYFISKIRKLEVLAGYFLTSIVIFGAQAIMQKMPVFTILGYFSYFYVFVMVIEPKTTPIKPLGKMIFGAGVALLIIIFSEKGVKFDAELCSLLVLNLFTPLLNKIPERRKI